MNRKLIIIFPAVVIFVLAAGAFALEGAGPEDIYGGPSENRNICTPYHFIPQERLSLSYDWKPGPDLIALEPQNWTYWTQGNNISQMVTPDGVYNLTSAWQQGALACIYPRGSAFKMLLSHCVRGWAVGEFNARQPKDTMMVSYIGGSQHAGRISTDLGYRDDLEPWNEKYTGKTDRVHVSTRPSDVEEWPEEFSDENGEPVIISDEDVVIVHYSVGYAAWNSGREQQDAVQRPFIEMQGRVMSFSAAIARDIQFYDYKLINKSQFHFFPDIGPYDVEEYILGPGAIFTMGDQPGGQKIAFVPGYRFGFTYEETFSDPAITGSTPMGGYAVIRALESRSYETGGMQEAELASFSGNVAGGSWGYYFTEMSSGMAWKIARPLEQFRYLQDPGTGDDPESLVPVVSRANNDNVFQYYYQGSPLCPGDTSYLVYALVCAFPSVGDPASMATSPEGLAQVAAQLIQNAAMAHSLYASGFKMPRPPS
ncbi:MAG: hypothetical protein JXQ83_09005, partial [Candidatus Glassbacteria bacterium]|nr:hypothetical protein [Candidatus Glassbacteria bacterium]